MPPRKTQPAAEPSPEALATTTAMAGTGTGCDPTMTSDGVLDVAATGDGGAREEEVSLAIDRLEELSDDLWLADDAGAIVAALAEHIVEMFRHRPKPWNQLSQAEQRDLLAAAEHNAKETVRHVVEAVARNGREAVRCLLVGFTDKGDDIKVELKVKALSKEETEAAVLGLHRARGKHVLLTVASADDYHERPANDLSEPDQPDLGFEAGDDQITAEDLASIQPTGGPPKDPRLEDEVHTGDTLIIPATGLCPARINLKTGMVEALPPGAELEDGWTDVRAATPAELAHERNRVADFGEEEEEEVAPAEA